MQTASVWPAARRKKAQLLLDFVRERGAVHPREVDDHFSHGTVKNYWGGSSNATTHLLDAMHYRGLLRVVRREEGIRVYAAHQHEPARVSSRAPRADRCLVDVVFAFMRRCRVRPVVPCAPSALCSAALAGELTSALKRASSAFPCARSMALIGTGRPKRRLTRMRQQDTVRLLAPFDPVVGTAIVSSSCGAGHTVSKPTHRRETQTRLLRSAAALARPRDWLGQSLSEEW